MTPKELVRGSINLVTLPDIALQVNGMISDPRFDAGDLGNVISNDPGLTSTLLKIVNSAFYGFQGKIDTVARAIVVVGIDDLRNLILATSAINTFSRIPQDLVDMTDFWIRSVQCGVIARILAQKCAVLQPERLFVAGLLSGIGSLVMYNKIPDECREILLAADDDHRIIGGLEQEILGFTHADVAAELIGLWTLPEALRVAIGWHLKPTEVEKYWMDVNVLYLANRLCEVSIQGQSVDDTLVDVPDETLQGLHLDREKIVRVLQGVGPDFSKVFDLIVPNCKMIY